MYWQCLHQCILINFSFRIIFLALTAFHSQKHTFLFFSFWTNTWALRVFFLRKSDRREHMPPPLSLTYVWYVPSGPSPTSLKTSLAFPSVSEI